MGDAVVEMKGRSSTPGALEWPRRRRRATRAGVLSKRAAPRVEPEPDDKPTEADPFRLGFRYRLRTLADGSEVVEQVGLSAEDLLYPKEGDVVTDGYPHASVLQPDADSLRRHLKKRPDTLVTSNVTLTLRSDGKNCGPDVAVIEGEIDRSKILRAVKLRELGARLVFEIEVVSTSEKEIEEKDTKKNIVRYAQEGVAEYFTVYPIVERQVRDLVGWRLDEGRYVAILPDAQKRVYSQTLDLFFVIDAKSKELSVFDGETGQRLLISDEEEAGRKEEAKARRRAEETARQAKKSARQAKKSAEQEAEARRQAEETARQATMSAEQETEARRQAEETACQAETAARQAEKPAGQEAEARRQAEETARQATKSAEQETEARR
ncbi:MAG: hypothetical protein GY856_38755, partial [bacterium]|nr:hypothetical protein [bacterium]